MDNDDWIFPTMYERMVELIQRYKADVARCDDLSDETQISKRIRQKNLHVAEHNIMN